MEIKSSSKRGTTPKPKNKKNKNQPLKVVYISNPMKVTTSPSKFRSLVQQLTGKGAVWPVDQSELQMAAAYDHLLDSQTVPNTCNGKLSDSEEVVKEGEVEFTTPDPSPDTSSVSDDLWFEPLDYADVLLMGGDLPLFNDHDFASLFQSDGVGC